MQVREGSLASVFEIKQLILLLNRLDVDEPLAYSISSKMIDFIADYYYNKDKADEKTIKYLVNLYETEHVHIQEKLNKALMKLMNKNFKTIRKALILAYREDLPEHFKTQLDKMLATVFSGIYFDYSTINEAKEELEKMMNNDENDSDSLNEKSLEEE